MFRRGLVVVRIMAVEDSWDNLRQEIDKHLAENALPRLSDGWPALQAFLAPDSVLDHLLLRKRDKVELAVLSNEVLTTLVVDRKHYLVAIVELDHVKGIDFGNYQGSVKSGQEIQLNVWFMDNTRFYWESGPEDLEQMQRFALSVSHLLNSGRS